MLSRCPHCDSTCEIDEAQLPATEGLARCGHCQGIFNVYGPGPGTSAPGAPASPPWDSGRPDGTQPLGVDRLVTRLSEERPRTRVAPAVTPPLPPRPTPPAGRAPANAGAAPLDVPLLDLAADEGPRHGRWQVAFGVLLAALLGAAALAQWAWHERGWLVARPELRPYLAVACGYLGCELPVLRAPGRFEVIQRDLAPSSEFPGALTLRARLRNNAAHEQPPPSLQLALFDNYHRVLARRRFAPAEYLPDGAVEGIVRPGEAVQIELLLEDPGAHATGFELAFH